MEGKTRGKSGKARHTLIGTDSTGAEYWLVPYSEARIGNRKFEIRNSKKQVPDMLKGMITDAATGLRLFEKWQHKLKAAKKTTAAKA